LPYKPTTTERGTEGIPFRKKRLFFALLPWVPTNRLYGRTTQLPDGGAG
jgi:hypothetical protein